MFADNCIFSFGKRFSKLVLFLLLSFSAKDIKAQQSHADAFFPIAKSIAIGRKATVRLYEIDSTTRRQTGGQFSGVVVSSDGIILTAGHAMVPDKCYSVRFPDGTMVTAMGKGRMRFNENNLVYDAGMLHIIEKGSWPFAQMRNSDNLVKGESCIGIGYPGQLDQLFPLVHVGRLVQPHLPIGAIVSSSVMEPGDSGGPLFDIQGNVIGIHSRVPNVSEGLNVETPSKMFLKYWTVLHIAKDYTSVPGEDSIKQTAFSLLTPSNDALNISGIVTKDSVIVPSGNVVEINSIVHGRKENVFGTLLNIDLPGQYYQRQLIVSKSSMVGNDGLSIRFGKSTYDKIKIVYRDKEEDIVVMSADGIIGNGISLSNEIHDTLTAMLGTTLYSPLFMDSMAKRSVLCAKEIFALPMKYSYAYIGIRGIKSDSGFVVKEVTTDSPLKDSILVGDILIDINGTPVTDEMTFNKTIFQYRPMDSSSIAFVRNGNTHNAKFVFGKWQIPSNDPAFFFKGGSSVISDGFKQVFVHDAAILPNECGGPVFDLHGNCLGVNIARFSRSISLAVPLSYIRKLILSGSVP